MTTISTVEAETRTPELSLEAKPPLAAPLKQPKRDPSRPPSYRSRAVVFVLVLALAVGAWWGSGYLFAYTDDAYLTSDVVSITPEVSGPIDGVHVTDNEWVDRGTTLFTIDPVPFQIALEQARAQEARAEAQLPVDQAQVAVLEAQSEAAQAAEKLAAATLGRNVPLARSGYVSAQTLDNATATHDEAAARRRSALAALEKAKENYHLDEVAVGAARAARRFAEWRLSRTNVVASVSGYVTHLAVQPGDMVSPSRAAVAIVDGNAWRVMANYKEYYLRHFTPDRTAWVWLDSHPWHLYRARIQGIAHGISRHLGSEALVPYVSPTVNWIRLQRRIPVRLTLLDSPGTEQLFMGADARVLILY